MPVRGLALALAGSLIGCSSDAAVELVIRHGDAIERVRVVARIGGEQKADTERPVRRAAIGATATSTFTFLLDDRDVGAVLAVALEGLGGTSTRALASAELDATVADGARMFAALLAGCGDGRIDGAEACDDGATLAGDGCGPACQLEPGWSCAGAPSRCCASACTACGVCCVQRCTTAESNCDVDCPRGCDCAVSCARGSNCRPECGDGALCRFDCRGASNCEARCSGDGASCTVTCDASTSNCEKVRCRGAACIIECGGTEKCGFEECERATSCPDGTVVCNRPCG